VGGQFFPRADLPQAPVNPLLGQLLLDAVLREPRAKAGEIDGRCTACNIASEPRPKNDGRPAEQKLIKTTVTGGARAANS